MTQKSLLDDEKTREMLVEHMSAGGLNAYQANYCERPAKQLSDLPPVDRAQLISKARRMLAEAEQRRPLIDELLRLERENKIRVI